jgi:hypothetical protein
VTDAQGRIGDIALYARDVTQSMKDDNRLSVMEKQSLHA